MSSSQASSVSLAIFLFILPTISASSCPTKLPCDSTIEIRPPFFVATPGFDPACRNLINVSCGDLGPELGLVTPSNGTLLLKEISYGTSTVQVQDVELSVRRNLSCSLTFSFTPPISDFLSSYSDLERWYSSINCGDNNLTLFRAMFGDDKAIHQNTDPDDASCHASPRFEWTLDFSDILTSITSYRLENFSIII